MKLGTDILEIIWDGRYACGEKVRGRIFLQTRVEEMMVGGYEVTNEEWRREGGGAMRRRR